MAVVSPAKVPDMPRQRVVTVPAAALNAARIALEQRRTAAAVRWAAGVYEREQRVELLCRSAHWIQDLPREVRTTREQGLSPVVLWQRSYGPVGDELSWVLDAFVRSGVERGAAIALIEGQSAVQALGWFMEADVVFPVDLLSLPGGGMLKMGTGHLWPLPEDEGVTRRQAVAVVAKTRRKRKGKGRKPQSADGGLRRDRFSRVIRVIGDGDAARGEEELEKAAHVRAVLMGCGRIGQRLAIELVQLGVGSKAGLVVVDPDVAEEGNRDVMLFSPSAVGMPKAEAVAGMATALHPGYRIMPIVGSLSDSVAAEAVAACDFVFSCVDRDSARYGVAALAASHLRPHLDLAGGSAFTRSRGVVLGGEVRLGIPASPSGCVGCMGSASPRTAQRELSLGREEELGQRESTDWTKERPGSSGAVVCSVVGEGMLVFLSVLQGKQSGSIWRHLSVDRGVSTWHTWTDRAATATCRVCGARGLTGLGDYGLHRGTRHGHR